MGRPKVPITTEGPVAVLAAALRQARATAGNPTYRAMASQANWSHNGLATADRGDRVPTWQCTQAYLRALGITEHRDLAMWRHKWHTAAQSANRRNVDKMRLPRQRIPETTTDANDRPDDGSAGPLRAPEITAESTTNDLRHKLIEVAAERGISKDELIRRIQDPDVRVVNGFHTSPNELRNVLDGDEPLTVTVALNIIALCGGEQADIQSWYRAWSKVYPVERRAQERLDQLKQTIQHENENRDRDDRKHGNQAGHGNQGPDEPDDDGCTRWFGRIDSRINDRTEDRDGRDDQQPRRQDGAAASGGGRPSTTVSTVQPPAHAQEQRNPPSATALAANAVISDLLPCVPRHRSAAGFLCDVLIRRGALILGFTAFGVLMAALLTANVPTASAAGVVVLTASVLGLTAGGGVQTSITIALIKAVQTQRQRAAMLDQTSNTGAKRTSECWSSC